MTPLTSVGLTLALLAGSPEPPTFFQLLGNSGTRYLIVHADDLGMCHSENAASFRAMEAGLVTCGSVMMPCPWVLEVVEYAKTHPDVDLGIHLTLNSEWMTYRWRPVAPVDKVRGLVDPQGYMWQSVEDVLKHATATEVETECRAQIEYALKLGLKPTHLDTHMGTILAKPEFAEIYLKLGREYGLPVMLPRYILAGDQYVTPPQAGSLLEKLAEARVPVIDALAVGV
ncbi:MAG: polysaccharide deacetylase family protein, partial [Armatimonadota bacterium]